MAEIRHVGIVVPARDEEHGIADCLTSLSRAMDHLRRACPRVVSRVIVVLDCCTDRTGKVVAEHGMHAIESAAGRVGCARHAGAMAVLHDTRQCKIRDEAVWLANTDADSTVPVDWLTTQLQIASSGVDAVIGTVTPAGLETSRNRLWHQRHQLAEGHPHVHGANLGVRASTYVGVGGFDPVAVDEDHRIVEKIQGTTDAWVATHRVTVTTSSRVQSRVDGGFATYLSGLGVEDSSCA